MILSILLCCCVILFGYLFWNKGKTKNENKIPQGPKPIPLIGNALQIGFKPHLRFTQWAQTYGGIFRIILGFQDAVFISNSKIFKEIFSEAASVGRLGDNCVLMEMSKGSNGIICSEGEKWEAQLKFTIRTLRNLGFSKTSMESMILDEVENMLEWFSKREFTPISGLGLFSAPVINSLWHMISGERCEWEQVKPPILQAVDGFFSEMINVCTNGVFFAPFLKSIAPGFFGWTRFVKSVKAMYSVIGTSIEHHKKTFIAEELRDYIDHYLLEIKNETNPSSSFYKDNGYQNLGVVIFDLFMAGSLTSSHLLSWSLLYLSENQKIQKKLQSEIDTVLGSRLSSLADRISMPYTEAVISEVLRFATTVALNPRRLEADITYSGYYLPKGTILFGNIYGCHHDPNVWGDPSVFRPERFLSLDETSLCIMMHL